MRDGLRVVIAAYGAAQFRALHCAVADAGHVPVAYLMSRSLRPGGPDVAAPVHAVADAVPPGMDLLLPGDRDHLPGLLAAYAPDVLLAFGFNWRLTRPVLDAPRLGALNIHPSLLPRYRGPSPLIWAVRHSEPDFGLTIHRMTERIDAGPVLAQAPGIPLPPWSTRSEVWELQAAALPSLVSAALERTAAGDPGTEQDESAATYAAPPPPEWYTVTWQDTRQVVYDQLRLRWYAEDGNVPVTYADRTMLVLGAALSAAASSAAGGAVTRVECADGPLWVTFADGPDSGLGEACPDS